MTPSAFRKVALSIPGATELPHFERTPFRVGKKIFATMTADGSEIMVPVRPLTRCFALLESDPDVFFAYGSWTQRNGALGVRLRPKAARKTGPRRLDASGAKTAGDVATLVGTCSLHSNLFREPGAIGPDGTTRHTTVSASS